MFNPKADAPFTDDKDEIIEQTQDMIQSYVSILASRPQTIYDNNGILPEQNLFSTQELYVAINTYARNNNMPELRVTHNSLGRYLSNATLFPHKRLNIARGKFKRTLYAIFRKKIWKRRNDKDWIFHYRTFSPDYKEKVRSKIEGNAREKADVIDIKTKERL